MKPPSLDDLIRDAKSDAPKEPDWQSIDADLFARIEREPRPLSSTEKDGDVRSGRVVWIGASLTLAAAAAMLVLVHPPTGSDSRGAEGSSRSAGAVVFGDVSVHGGLAHAGTQLAAGDRIDVIDTAYFEAPGAAGSWAVRWTAQRGSVLGVEHPASPLVLSLDRGSAEAQVTPVPSGEAFAIDVKASSGETVRVAVHGTHLRVARDGDHLTVDLTEGVVSIGAPPRRGSTLGTLVTAPAHIDLDARDVRTMRVDHALSAVRTAEAVVHENTPKAEIAVANPLNPTVLSPAETLLLPEFVVGPQTQQRVVSPNVAVPIVETSWLRSSDEVMAAIQTCTQYAVAPNTTFSTTLTMKVSDDGSVEEGARFMPPLPEGPARDCAANVIYKRTKLSSGAATIAIEVKR